MCTAADSAIACHSTDWSETSLLALVPKVPALIP